MPQINIGNLENQEKILEMLQTLYASQFNPAGFDWGTFFGLRRTGELFSTKFYNYKTTDTGIGTKMYDSVGHTCEPSTDTVKGQDDFEHHNAFWYCLCNFEVTDEGLKVPTAIEGQSTFKRTGNVDVGVLTPPLYWGHEEVEDGYIKHFSDSERPTKRPDLTLTLMPHCRDNKMQPMPYGIVPVYYAGTGTDGKIYGASGLAIKNNLSYTQLHAEMVKKGAGWVGAGSERSAYLKNFLWIKYADLNSQKYFRGCTSCNLQYKVAAVEDPGRSVVITKAQAANLYVGLTVSIGNSADGAAPDRGATGAKDLANLVKITKIEDIDGTNSRVYVDVAEDFTATENTYISSMPLHAGQTDTVLGNDGQLANDGKHSFKIQGVEDGVGAYCVSGNEMINKVSATKEILYNRNGQGYLTSAPGDSWKKVAEFEKADSTDIWIGEESIDLETGSSFVKTIGNSDSKGVGDRHYWGGDGAGLRERLDRGPLWRTSHAGLSCLNAGYTVSGAYWDCAGSAS